MHLFDICVITASDPHQAESFRSLLGKRVERGLYPGEIDFKVYHDPEGGRVGSGGGTILALENLAKDYKVTDPKTFFATHRILLIHAGGESRRLPCYVPEGKLFAPVPVASSSIIPPVVLDLQLSLFLKYPWKRGEVVVTSGDVVIDFDPLSVPDARGDICGFAKPTSLEQGSRHGVFKFDRTRTQVDDFFQKASPDFLRREARLEGTDQCALDMGIVSLSADFASGLLGLMETTSKKTAGFASELRAGNLNIDLYLEIMTATLPGISYEAFLTRVESQSKVPTAIRKRIFDSFHGYSIRGAVTGSTTFLHFGSLSDFGRSCLELANKGLRPFYARENEEIEPVCSPELILYNSKAFNVPAGRRHTLLAEGSQQCTISQALGDNVFVGIDHFSTDILVPQGMCIDERHVENKLIRLVYSSLDTFKKQESLAPVVFCGKPMEEWLKIHQLEVQDIWEDRESFDLLEAKLFVENASPAFLAGYWQKPFDPEWVTTFRSARRYSIAEINRADNVIDREQRRQAIRTALLRDRLLEGIGWRFLSLNDFRDIATDSKLRQELALLNQTTDDPLLAAYRTTLLENIEQPGDRVPPMVSFTADYVGGDQDRGMLRVAVKEDQIVWARSSVRFDLGGGWSDTPPYTLMAGGQVTNVAVDLNGQPPIQVFCRPITDKHIRFHSIDLGVTETVTEFEMLSDYRNPHTPFGLPKGALSLLGLTPERCGTNDLVACLEKIGCGIEITLLCAVPKGSGLGTSSILGGTILAALHRFFGIETAKPTLFRQVLQMELMLTTCGGWQDQIGGIEGGVKYIESKPGLRPDPIIHQLDPWMFEDPATKGCFTLYYTGVTRLAKNILQDVVSQVNTRTPSYFFTLNHIRDLSLSARQAISLRNLPMMATTLAQSWEANKRIHPGTTNKEVEELLGRVRGLYRGMKLLGAGGGGYALFVSENGSQAEELRHRLEAIENPRARVVDFSLNRNGLQVTVS